MLLTQNNQDQCCSEAEAEQCCPTPILSVTELMASAAEILQSDLSHMHGNSTIALGGESRGNTFAATNFHAAELAGVNFLGMESTGSGCCPSIEATELSGDVHAPFGINQVNVAPTYLNFFNRIDDAKSLIGINDVRPDENQIDQNICCQAAGNRSDQALSQGSGPDKERRENGSSTTQQVATLGSKDLSFAHDSIFSHTSRMTDGQVA